MRNQRLNLRGFTLLEFMVVIVILGVMLGAAVPRISSSMGNTRVNRAVGTVALDIELALSQAARLRQPVRLSVNSSTKELTVTNRATSAVLLRRQFGDQSEYQLRSISSSPTSVDVFPTGLVSQAMTISLVGASRTRTVSVTRAGQVRITS